MFRKSKIIFVFIIVFLAILLSLPFPISKSIKIKLIDCLSSLVKGSNYLVRDIFSIKDLFNAIRENKELHKKIDELTNQLNKGKEILQENQRLMQLLEIKKSLPYETIACRVIARDAGAWYKTLIIDKGKDSGVFVDMPVVSFNGGIIGRITESSNGVSRVLLITDVNSSIGCMTQDTRAAGLVEGSGSSGCFFNLIQKKLDVQTGGIVVTSGLGSVFPKGLVVGEITDVSSGEQGLYKVAKVRLYVDIDKIEEVLVIKKSKN